MKGGELAHIYGGLYPQVAQATYTIISLQSNLLDCYAGNNPVRYTDPDGREIDATFEVTEYEKTTDGWKAKGNLILTDLDTNKTITIGAYSGGIKQAPDGVSLPIPLGEYDILEQKANQDFFRLEAKDSCYGNDKVDGIITPQDLLRLHYEGVHQRMK